VPRETAMLPMPGTTRFPTRDELGVARPVWPDPADARKVAGWLIKAENPCIFTAKSGRNPESVAELVQLAELLALPVMDIGRVDRMNFPATHPLYGTGPAAKDADVLLIIESPVPYMPPRQSPSPDAKVVWVDVDPVQSRYKTMEHQADLWLPVQAATAARSIYEAATQMLSQSDMTRIADRRKTLEERKRELTAREEKLAEEAAHRRPMHPRWVAHEVGKIMQPDTILLNDAVSNSDYVSTYAARERSGTYFQSGGSSGGWGSGAAFGAKLASPDSDVVLATGDGYFMFGTPMAAIWCASHYKAAFLTVVFVNRSYSTGTRALRRAYPEGVAVEIADYEGGLFDPPPDFAKLAEAGNGYGETVAEPEQLGPALKRGLEANGSGMPAIIDVIVG